MSLNIGTCFWSLSEQPLQLNSGFNIVSAFITKALELVLWLDVD